MADLKPIRAEFTPGHEGGARLHETTGGQGPPPVVVESRKRGRILNQLLAAPNGRALSARREQHAEQHCRVSIAMRSSVDRCEVRRAADASEGEGVTAELPSGREGRKAVEADQPRPVPALAQAPDPSRHIPNPRIEYVVVDGLAAPGADSPVRVPDVLAVVECQQVEIPRRIPGLPPE